MLPLSILNILAGRGYAQCLYDYHCWCKPLTQLQGFLLVDYYHVIFPLTIDHVIPTWPIIGYGILARVCHVIGADTQFATVTQQVSTSKL